PRLPRLRRADRRGIAADSRPRPRACLRPPPLRSRRRRGGGHLHARDHAARRSLRAGPPGTGRRLVPRRLLHGLCLRPPAGRRGGGARGLAKRALRAGPRASPLLRAFPRAFHHEGARGRVPRPPRRLSLDADLSGNKPAQLMIWGYVFHSWELLGMWAWTPAFVAAALAVHGTSAAQAAGFGASLSALFHVMGIVASAVGGTLSDRWGRTAVIAGMMLVSSACSFSFGWMLGGPLLLLVLVG